MKIINYIVGFILLVSMCCMDSENYIPFLIAMVLCVLYFAIYGLITGGIFYEGED